MGPDPFNSINLSSERFFKNTPHNCSQRKKKKGEFSSPKTEAVEKVQGPVNKREVLWREGAERLRGPVGTRKEAAVPVPMGVEGAAPARRRAETSSPQSLITGAVLFAMHRLPYGGAAMALRPSGFSFARKNQTPPPRDVTVPLSCILKNPETLRDGRMDRYERPPPSSLRFTLTGINVSETTRWTDGWTDGYEGPTLQTDFSSVHKTTPEGKDRTPVLEAFDRRVRTDGGYESPVFKLSKRQRKGRTDERTDVIKVQSSSCRKDNAGTDGRTS